MCGSSDVFTRERVVEDPEWMNVLSKPHADLHVGIFVLYRFKFWLDDGSRGKTKRAAVRQLSAHNPNLMPVKAEITEMIS